MQLLDSWKDLAEGDYTMRVGIGDAVSARAVGVSNLIFSKNCYLNLNDMLFIPDFHWNLIYVSKIRIVY